MWQQPTNISSTHADGMTGERRRQGSPFVYCIYTFFRRYPRFFTYATKRRYDFTTHMIVLRIRESVSASFGVFQTWNLIDIVSFSIIRFSIVVYYQHAYLPRITSAFIRGLHHSLEDLLFGTWVRMGIWDGFKGMAGCCL